MSALCVHWFENRLLVALKISFPNCEVEIVHCEQKIWIERRSFEGEPRSVFLLAVESHPHVFCNLRCIIWCLDWFNTPINLNEVALIRECPKCRRRLPFLKQNSTESKFTRAILLKQVQSHHWLPLSLNCTLKHIFIHVSRVPNINDTILWHWYQMRVFSFTWRSFIDINWRWNESEVGNECLVWLLDYWMTKVLQMHKLSFLISDGVIILTTRLLATIDNVVLRWQVPNDYLTVKASTDEHIGIIRMPFDGRHLDRSIQQIRQRDDVVILEIEYKKLRIKRFSLNNCSCIEIHVVYHTHGDKIRPRWMKLNASNSLVLAVITIKKRPRLHGSRIDLATLCCFGISEHLEIILEYINDFVWLQSCFNLKGDSINKLVELLLLNLSLLLIFFWHFLFLVILNLLLEVRRIVHSWFIDRSTKVGLRLNPLHLVSCLKTDVECLLKRNMKNVLCRRLQINARVVCIFFHERRGVVTEFLPLLRDSHRH